MTDRDALEAAILADPADDTPRLALADWLDEHAEGRAAEPMRDRAALIRVQVELARLSAGVVRSTTGGRGQAHGRRRRELLAREQELLRRYRPEGARDLDRVGRWRLRRGFVDEVRTGPARFLEAADVIARHPVTRLRFASLQHYDESRLLQRFARRLAAWPALARVESLDFFGHSAGGAITITPDTLAVIWASPELTRLREIGLVDNVGMEGVLGILAGHPRFARLTRLDLTTCATSVEEYEQLYRVPAPPLERLGLGWTGLDVERAARLAMWPALATVRDLDLSGNEMGVDGCVALANSRHLGPRLENLRMLNCATPGMAVEALVAGGVLDNLRRLATGPLTFPGVGPAGAAALARLRNLRVLNLPGNHVGPDGARAIAQSEAMAGLRRLSLGVNSIGDEGVRAIAGSPHLRRLTHLALYANRITDDGLAALVNSPVLRSVVRLRIGGNHAVTDRSADALVVSPHLGRLRRLECPATAISAAGLARLSHRYPVLSIIGDDRPDLPPAGGNDDIPF